MTTKALRVAFVSLFLIACALVTFTSPHSNVLAFQTPVGTCVGSQSGGPILTKVGGTYYGCVDLPNGTKQWEPVFGATQPFGIGGLQVAHAQYNFTNDGGAVGAIIPLNNVSLPINAVIVGATVNSTTAVTSAGSATLTVGTTAGSSATALLGSTAKASLSLNALINGAATLAAPVKLSAAGSINVTVGTAALTAGVVEIYVYFYSSLT